MKNFTIVLVIILAIAGIYLFFNTSNEKESTLYKFETGNVTTYKLQFVQKSTLQKSDLMPQNIYYKFSLDAYLHLKVLKKSNTEIWSAYQLSNTKLSGAGVDKLFLDNVLPYYESMFIVKHDKYGKILEIHFPGLRKNFSGLAQLICLLEVRNLEQKAYKVTEEDETGRYEAFYKKDETQIKKQKTKYTYIKKPSNMYSVKIKKYKLDSQVDPRGNWIKALNLDENLELYDENKVLFAKNLNSVKLEKLPLYKDFPKSIGSAKNNIDTYLQEFKKKKDTDTDVFQKIEDINIKEKFSENGVELEDLTENLNRSQDYLYLQDYLRVFPDEALKLKDFLLKTDDTTNMRLIAMLPNVKTAQSQQLLLEIAQTQNAKQMTKLRSVIALGDVDSITANSVGTLKTICDFKGNEKEKEISDTSLLALSSHADNNKFKDGIISYIRSEYVGAQSNSKEKNVLFAMQNAGAENFLDEIGDSLGSNSEKVRKVALQTLATIKDESLRKDLLQEEYENQEDKELKQYIKALLRGR